MIFARHNVEILHSKLLILHNIHPPLNGCVDKSKLSALLGMGRGEGVIRTVPLPSIMKTQTPLGCLGLLLCDLLLANWVLRLWGLWPKTLGFMALL